MLRHCCYPYNTESSLQKCQFSVEDQRNASLKATQKTREKKQQNLRIESKVPRL